MALNETNPPVQCSASRSRRAAAFAVDAVLAAAAYFAGVAIAALLFGECTSPRGMGCALAALMVAAVALCLTLVPLLVVQMLLLARRGCTIGMRFAGLRVVRSDGSQAGFVRGVLLRSLPLVAAPLLAFGLIELAWMLAMAVVNKQTLLEHWNLYERLKYLKFEAAVALAAVLLIADAAGCFRADRRSLRDLCADTVTTGASPPL